MSTTRIATEVTELPSTCPTWCLGEHQRAYDEGCDIASAGRHTAPDLGGHLAEIRHVATDTILRCDDNSQWRLELEAEHRRRFWEHPWIYLEVSREDRRVTLQLDSGDARKLARQLVHFADLMDLDS